MRLLLIAGVLGSTTVAAVAVQAPAESGRDKTQLVCKSHVPTGTRFARRGCRTRDEQAKVTAQQRQDANALIDGARPIVSTCMAGGGGGGGGSAGEVPAC